MHHFYGLLIALTLTGLDQTYAMAHFGMNLFQFLKDSGKSLRTGQSSSIRQGLTRWAFLKGGTGPHITNVVLILPDGSRKRLGKDTVSFIKSRMRMFIVKMR